MSVLTGSTGYHTDLPLVLLKINFENLMNFIKELWIFLRIRKKLWLAPIIFVIVLLGTLLIAAQGSVIAPFIYTLF